MKNDIQIKIMKNLEMSGRTSQSSGKGPAVGIKGKNTKGKNIKGLNKSKNKTEKIRTCPAIHATHDKDFILNYNLPFLSYSVLISHKEEL